LESVWAETNGLAVSARIHGTAGVGAFPFGVGLNGVGGYKLQVTPARILSFTEASKCWARALLLDGFLDDASPASHQVKEVMGVEGKVWKQGTTELILGHRAHRQNEPIPGRASWERLMPTRRSVLMIADRKTLGPALTVWSD
jgi:hypothetical protein